MSKSIDRWALRPLHRRRHHSLTKRRILEAVAVIDAVVASDRRLDAQHKAIVAARHRRKVDWTDPTQVREWVALNQSLRTSRRISWARYVFAVSSAVEHFHEGRWFAKSYAGELDPLSKAIQRIERSRMPAGRSLSRLNARYDAILDKHFADTFVEFGLSDLGEMYRNRRAEFDEIRERGRRHMHHADRYPQALRDLVDEGYSEATTAAAAGTFRAAVTLLGASLEGLLLLRCLRSRTGARRVANALPSRLRKRAAGELEGWTFEILVEVCDRAGWLAELRSATAEYSASGLAHSLRTMRNWIHPAREARDRPWQGVYEQDYVLAHALYTLVATAVLRPRAISRAVSDGR